MLSPDTKVFAKRQFSMMTDQVSTHLHSLAKQQIILCGVEAHVCIQQTVLDLLSNNDEDGTYEVFLVVDAISSQRCHDRSVALERMKNAGAVITTTESKLALLWQQSLHHISTHHINTPPYHINAPPPSHLLNPLYCYRFDF